MQWLELQEQFAAALRNPELPAPTPVTTASGATGSPKRFNVYRNNVAVSLCEALAAGFPVVQTLVGDDFFSAMAKAYVSENAPNSPVMLDYGEGFAAFIARFEPARSLPYLSDVAAFEWAWNRAYHSEDCAPVEIAELQGVDPDLMDDVRLTLHPSLRLLSFDLPAVSIWHLHQIHQEPAEAMRELRPEAECALIVRPHWDVDVRRIPAAAFKFFSALAKGLSLGQAAEMLDDADAAQIGGMLQLFFATGSVTGLTTGREPIL